MRCFFACAASVAGGALLLLAGCADVDSILSDVRAHRMSSYEAWQAERSARDVKRKPLSGHLSLTESVLIGLGNSREVETALLEQTKASGRITEAWSEALPKVNLDAGYTRVDKVTSFGGTTVGAINNYSADVTVSQPLYRGGAVSAGIRAARLYSICADEQLRGTYQRVIFEVQKAYYDARLALELERASAEAVTVAQRHLQDVQKNFQAGVSSAFDVLRAEVELANLVAQHVQDLNRYHLAVTSLLDVMGVSQESAIELADALPYQPLEASMEEAVRTAFLRQSDILQGELNVRLQREAVAAAKAGYWPQADAFFTETYTRPDPHDSTRDRWGDAWRAGLSLTFPLFDGFRTAGRVKQAKAALGQSEVALRDTEATTLLQIRQAILSMEDAAKFIASQEKNKQQAEEALRLVELGFKEGIRKEVEVLDARRALTAAQANYAQAIYDYAVGRLQLEKAMGTLEPPKTGNAK